MKIVYFVLMFGIIVFVHEFGHFIFAKLNKVKVNEFSIGMGPAIAKWGKGETAYFIRLLPIVGYCLMEGQAEDSNDKNSFNNKTVLQRLSVLLAGPFFNFVLAFLLSIIICHYCVLDPASFSMVQPGSAADEAGLQAGDTIISLNGERIYNFREIQLFRMVNDPTKPIDIVYERDGKRYNTTLTMKPDENGAYYFGVLSEQRLSSSFVEELLYSFYEVRFNIKTTIYSVKMLFSGGASIDDLSGPVGIGQMMGDVVDEAQKRGGFIDVLLNVINFTVLISANLGVMNLLPIPAVDGGRILFCAIEGISGRKIPKNKENIVNFIGFILLMLLTIVVFFNDISKLFR